MTNEQYRDKSCTQKVRYINRKQARLARNRFQLSCPGERMSVYVCDFCGGFHIGHKRGSAKISENNWGNIPENLLQNIIIRV